MCPRSGGWDDWRYFQTYRKGQCDGVVLFRCRSSWVVPCLMISDLVYRHYSAQPYLPSLPEYLPSTLQYVQLSILWAWPADWSSKLGDQHSTSSQGSPRFLSFLHSSSFPKHITDHYRMMSCDRNGARSLSRTSLIHSPVSGCSDGQISAVSYVPRCISLTCPLY